MPKTKDSGVSNAARQLSLLGSSKGGKARANSLSQAERKSIAKKAAAARWEIPRALYGSSDRPLRIGDLEIEAYVLDDGTRVLSQAGFLQALGRHRKANVRREGEEEGLPPILQGKAIKPFIGNDLREKSKPIVFRPPRGGRASGYRAEVLPMVCDVYLQARESGDLPKNQLHVAKQAELLVRSLAKVGIIALVDEATGYQHARSRDALAEILEKFISEELCRWVKTFPDEYFDELFRLKDVDIEGIAGRKPQWVGKITNNIVYDRLAPGVREKLQEITPRTTQGNRSHKFHQRLTPDDGHPKLREHLASVIALMKASDDWETFKKMIDRALPKHKKMPLFDIDE